MSAITALSLGGRGVPVTGRRSVGVDLDGDVRVRLAAGAAPEVDDRAAAAELRRRLDPRRCSRRRLEQLGSITCATATRVVDRRAVEAVARLVEARRRSRAARRRPRRRGPRRAAARRARRVISAWCVTSRPIIVTSSPLAKTRCAASGSAQMLNSAAGVTLPSPIAPPIRTIRSRPRRRGGARAGSATFVSGPVGTSVSDVAALDPLGEEVDGVLRRRARVVGARQVGAVEAGLAVDVRGDVAARGRAAGRRPRRPGCRRGRRARAPAARSRSSCRASGCRRRS